MHFGQNDRGRLRATAVTRGWNGHRKKSQHTKLTVEKKFPPPPLPEFELATFRLRVRRSNQRAVPTPRVITVSFRMCKCEMPGHSITRYVLNKLCCSGFFLFFFFKGLSTNTNIIEYITIRCTGYNVNVLQFYHVNR